ncbi:hypothetical protein ACJJTC_017620 [Scirpophaga incertulas]
MDCEYDLKFEEMKKYIPFLENMINRLESTSSVSNPRQAQLDKIRSLRDLLLDKKKRMKMDNLLKCEQVLVNLYAKVEQREALPGIQPAHNSKDVDPALESVRNKLKLITTKTIDQDTLPEIARASATEELCTPGSKEPALFQRRPNKTTPSRSLQRSPVKSSASSLSRRNYTRVLVSPEPSRSRWSSNERSTPLFSRRSPRSPKTRSSPYTRKEKNRRKNKQELSKKGKDLNITLNVPEESLNSLNTKDILSRIMDCNDNDVDIDTLREAKRQILSELKHTGAKYDDISDLLLKAYKKKDSKKKEDVEEGELSDSESETIQSIYGNFILDDSENSSKKKGSIEEKPRKIQICLVLNSTKNKPTDSLILERSALINDDFELNSESQPHSSTIIAENDAIQSATLDNNSMVAKDQEDEVSTDKTSDLEKVATNQPANFYTPLKQHECSVNIQESSSTGVTDNSKVNIENLVDNEKILCNTLEISTNETEPRRLDANENTKAKEVEIPLLHEKSVASQQPKEDIVSEIDILQALKNEILSESLSIPGSEITPLLHQPKITKVLSVQEIIPKKRISIEKYKEKAITPCTSTSLFVNDPNTIGNKEDNLKKQSLKLTEKEYERFNLSSKIELSDAELSDEEKGKSALVDEIYAGLEPKSPDDELPNDQITAPIIIPTEPVKTIIAPSKIDVDMRQLNSPTTRTPALVVNDLKSVDKSRMPIDPRMRKDLNPVLSPDISVGTNLINKERVPAVQQNNYPSNMTPNRTSNNNAGINPSVPPSMTPNRNPNMTPNARSYDISHTNFDMSDNMAPKHVYTPMFPLYDQSNIRDPSVAKEQENQIYRDNSLETGSKLRLSRWEIENRDRDPRSTSIQRDNHDYSNQRCNDTYNNNFENHNSRYSVDRRDSFECPRTPLPSFGRSDPSTAPHPYGRLETPLTPLHPFGRSDCPPTPSHQFGRLDCPQTPSHPFGRLECSLTPSHSFGRSDCPQTPSHSFGRSDMPMTPSHPFGRSEHSSRDPRLNRSSDYDNIQNDDRTYYTDRNKSNYNYNNTDAYARKREQSVGRFERNTYTPHDHEKHCSSRDQSRSCNREQSVGRTISNNYDNQSFSRDYTGDKDKRYRGYHREPSIGRSVHQIDNFSLHRNIDRMREDTENQLSIQSHGGRSFVIDTSVNSTFQDFINNSNEMQVFDNNFDNRRKRAASVGRMFQNESSTGRSIRKTSEVESFRESSVGRSFRESRVKCFRETSVGRTQLPKYTFSQNDHNRNDFRRAQSVGRDRVGVGVEKSFFDIKADFREYQANYDAKYEHKKKIQTSHIHYTKKDNRTSHQKSDLQVVLKRKSDKSDIKKYSPSSNSRDPRVRREINNSKTKYTQKEKNLGIVYTNDNITKGTILGPGYGVKNYKIPKIKRPVEEKINDDSKKQVKTCEDSNISETINLDQNKKSKKSNKSEVNIKLDTSKKCLNNPTSTVTKSSNNDDKIEKRSTLSKKSDTMANESIDLNIKKSNKKVIKVVTIDSDSDTENLQILKTTTPLLKNSIDMANENSKNKKKEIEISEKLQTQTEHKFPKNNYSAQLDNNFTIDDIEIFSDNLTSDPVVDSINDIIAGLDTELEPEKIASSEDFTSDVNIDNMFVDMDTNEDNGKKLSEELKDISEVIENDLVESDNIQSNQKEIIDITEKGKEFSEEVVVNVLENLHDIALKNPEEDSKRHNNKEIAASQIMLENLNNTSENNSNENCKSINTKENETRSIDVIQNSVNENFNNAVDNKTEVNCIDEIENLSENMKKDISKGENEVRKSDMEGGKNKINSDICAAPDSTNEIVSEQKVMTEVSTDAPDSTNESQNDYNSVVTSSHDSVENVNTNSNAEASTSNKDMASMDSLGNILSLLQNKSKLKEMLSKENENIPDTNNSSLQNSPNHNYDDTHSQVIVDQSACHISMDEISVPNDVEKSNECSEKVDRQIKEPKIKIPTTNRRKGKFTKKRKCPQKSVKRLTRSGAKQIAVKKPSRELLKLQQDIREMFISDDVINATGLRMCRLAKLVDEDKVKSKEDIVNTEETFKPVVVLEKYKDVGHGENIATGKPIKKKSGLKPKQKIYKSVETENSAKEIKLNKYKPGPKSKKQAQKYGEDPYEFESDSLSESNYNEKSEDNDVGDSESEYESNSSINSDLLVDVRKKTKRKKSEWLFGITKNKSKKKKSLLQKKDDISLSQKLVNLSPTCCFTDKTYCFRKNVSEYFCRLCTYNGSDIVNHYKQSHPHSEIPLSRLSPEMAKQAIDQCEEINFQAISKIPSEKYVCRFCFKEFSRKKAALEAFFWHVVSMHTGEYKQLCSICEKDKCSFYLDIPPPPKDVKGQLIGYICEKCNFTQISLENLKTHVIVRHNDEQTEVYTINLAVMSKKSINKLIHRSRSEFENEPSRTLRSRKSNQSLTGTSDEQSDITDSDVSNELINKPPHTALKSMITFETDDSSETSSTVDNNVFKLKKSKDKNSMNETTPETIMDDTRKPCDKNDSERLLIEPIEQTMVIAPDIYVQPHFKVSYTESGSKEYLCCINALTYHYKTSLVISLKKHVQTKHSEFWDGYCTVCKVFVPLQGKHSFKECLEHYLDMHIDNLSIVENVSEKPQKAQETEVAVVEPTAPNKTYINVRPLSELLRNDSENITTQPEVNLSVVPKLEFFSSLEVTNDERLQAQDDSYPAAFEEPKQEERQYKYEENQAEVISQKHRVVLDAMLNKNKLVHVFKCAGRYCSYTSDSIEDSLLHASTHQRIGGEKSLICTYCDFDCFGNAIDLVMHVFKAHSQCPYVCGYCFYRAASTQLVLAHMSRLHSGSKVKVLSVANASPPAPGKMLPREQVVRSYICAHHDCKFRHYTAGKFCEHLEQDHSEAEVHPCYFCDIAVPTAAALIQHMKVHGLNIYQCVMCCFGADTESSLLAHTSEKHYYTEPFAYIRTSHKKHASSVSAVALTFIQKAKVPVEIVQPCTANKNPVKDAERSIDLEKLIGQTSQSAEVPVPVQPMVTIEPVVNIEPVESIAPGATAYPMLTIEPLVPSETVVPVGEPSRTNVAVQGDQIEESILPDSEPAMILPTESSTLVPSLSVAAPLSTPPQQLDISEQTTPILKSEVTLTPMKNFSEDVVYCLDSDDDDVPADTSDISSSVGKTRTQICSTEQEYEKISPTKLFRCPKCSIVYKYYQNCSIFKKHLLNCCPQIKDLQCAHCNHSVTSHEDLIRHYIIDHYKLIYTCSICHEAFYSASTARQHIKVVHKVGRTVIWELGNEPGGTHYVISHAKNPPANAKAAAAKPARGAGAGTGTGTGRRKSAAAERRALRYGPGDIDRLPINPILDALVTCALCEFSTKVRLNMVRHLQMHKESQPAPSTAPVNPVPHLETNEMYFDRMVNLASSSLAVSDRSQAEAVPLQMVAADAVARYPRFVPEHQRYACGTCSYVSADEPTLRQHWEIEHEGVSAHSFKCVHCPPYQQLDTKNPITVARIIAHLKMHGANLYACSGCPYYHYRRYMMDKHVTDSHAGTANVLLVREDTNIANAAPTMDLKPWHCGLCDFTSMIRPEVAEHTSKCHQSKMQFKCFYCQFRASTEENVTKHQAQVHPGKAIDLLYFYYREGSIPGENDGGPLWMRQRKRCGLDRVVVKQEPSPDLNIVKQEQETVTLLPTVQLCSTYGQFCEPNGLLYKCPLCETFTDATEETMRSHLYEELNYRRWACAFCSYKAFHKTGLNDHMKSEHRTITSTPTQMPINVNIEAWVKQALQHQTSAIARNKENFAKQRIVTDRPPPKEISPPVSSVNQTVQGSEKNSQTSPVLDDLIKAFGPLGHASGMLFCCPKCSFQFQDETVFSNHMETELNKIRWCCSTCSETFTTYHQALFHCRSKRDTDNAHRSARPVEAPRDPALRVTWLKHVVNSQKGTIQLLKPVADTVESEPEENTENSLLVVRYEKIITPEEPLIPRKRPASPSCVESDKDDSVQQQSTMKRLNKDNMYHCSYCNYRAKYQSTMKMHMYRHFNLKPYTCNVCQFNGSRRTVLTHLEKQHASLVQEACGVEFGHLYRQRELPASVMKQMNGKMRSLFAQPEVPEVDFTRISNTDNDGTMNVCLVCEKSFTEEETVRHGHENMKSEFGKKGDVVVKCCICLILRIDKQSFEEHHDESHPNLPMNYALYKLLEETRQVHCCTYCKKRFKYTKDLRSHHNAVHGSLPLKFRLIDHTLTSNVVEIDDDVIEVEKTSSSESPAATPNKVARKSTTKLPAQTVAKKSTTKLPLENDDVCNNEEYSYYGDRRTSLETYANVTTLMSFCNRMMPFTVKKLSELINIEPVVLVKDVKSNLSPSE